MQYPNHHVWCVVHVPIPYQTIHYLFPIPILHAMDNDISLVAFAVCSCCNHSHAPKHAQWDRNPGALTSVQWVDNTRFHPAACTYRDSLPKTQYRWLQALTQPTSLRVISKESCDCWVSNLWSQDQDNRNYIWRSVATAPKERLSCRSVSGIKPSVLNIMLTCHHF